MSTTRIMTKMANLVASEELSKLVNTTFNLVNKNGDGHISHDQIVTALQNLFQDKYSLSELESAVDEIIEEIDLDKNGTIEQNELMLYFAKPKLRIAEPDEELREIFALFDLDGNGKISHQELKEIFSRFGIESSNKKIKKIIEACDTNEDGEIDFEEFKKFMRT